MRNIKHFFKRNFGIKKSETIAAGAYTLTLTFAITALWTLFGTSWLQQHTDAYARAQNGIGFISFINHQGITITTHRQKISITVYRQSLGPRQTQGILCNTQAEREKGLTGKAIGTAIFTWRPHTQPKFWMKGCPHPIWIFWLRNHKVLGGLEMQPNSTTPHPAPLDANAALEIIWRKNGPGYEGHTVIHDLKLLKDQPTKVTWQTIKRPKPITHFGQQSINPYASNWHELKN